MSETPDAAPPSPSPAPAPAASWLSRRAQWLLAGGAAFAGLLAIVIVLSYLNSRDYYLVCGAHYITAERGSKWPWGRSRLSGDQYAPIPVGRDTRCQERTFATREALHEVFAQALLDEASARVRTGVREDVDEAERQLQQARLLARTLPGKRDAIISLEGDVEYWRAVSEIHTAIEQLEGAAARFRSAAEKKPRHSTDATQWGAYTGDLADGLRRGPLELRSDLEFGPDSPPPFSGTDTAPALPRAPTPGEPTTPPPAAIPGPTPATPDAGPSEPPPAKPRPDAGLPTGGVLL